MALKPLTCLPSGTTALLDQLGDSILVTDVYGVIRYVNGAFERLTGYSREEAVGQTPRLLKSGVHPPEVYLDLWQTLLRGERFRFICTNRRKDGQLYQEGLVLSPILDARGEVSGFFSMGREIIQTRATFDLFRLIADSSPAGIYLLQDGDFHFVNGEFSRLTGYEAAEMIGRRWWQLVHTDDREMVRERARLALKGESPMPFEYRVVTNAGEVRWILESVQSVSFTGVASMSGRFTSGHFIDITDRKLYEHKLDAAVSLYAATVEATADAIVVVDLMGELIAHNQKMLQLWDIRPAAEQVTSSEVKQAVNSQLRRPSQMTEIVKRVMAEPGIETADTLDLYDDRSIEVHTKPQFIDSKVVGRVFSFRDVSERRQMEARLLHLATHDSLTGLFNRRGFQERIEAELDGNEIDRGALLLLDLDRFKDINDSLGHQAGDDILAQVGFLLTEAFPGYWVARFGGDEFAVYMGNAGAATARKHAESMLDMLAKNVFRVGGSAVTTTASAGIALAPDHATKAVDLFAVADLAMYEAKARGRDRLIVYSSRVDSGGKVQFRREWQSRLSDAIHNEDLRFSAQPIVDLATCTTAQYELLVRLPGYGGAAISPKEVSEVAERIGLGVELDRLLVKNALKFGQRLADAGEPASVLLNISSKALHDQGVEAEIEAGLSSPGALVLGLPTASMADLARTVRRIDTLRGIGCKIAVDEMRRTSAFFRPTGRFPFDYFWVDPGVIGGLATSTVDQEMARGMVSIAHALGMQCAAEAVDDEATASILRELGFDFGQGPYFGRKRSLTSILRKGPTRRAA